MGLRQAAVPMSESFCELSAVECEQGSRNHDAFVHLNRSETLELLMSANSDLTILVTWCLQCSSSGAITLWAAADYARMRLSVEPVS